MQGGALPRTPTAKRVGRSVHSGHAPPRGGRCANRETLSGTLSLSGTLLRINFLLPTTGSASEHATGEPSRVAHGRTMSHRLFHSGHRGIPTMTGEMGRK